MSFNIGDNIRIVAGGGLKVRLTTAGQFDYFEKHGYDEKKDAPLLAMPKTVRGTLVNFTEPGWIFNGKITINSAGENKSYSLGTEHRTVVHGFFDNLKKFGIHGIDTRVFNNPNFKGSADEPWQDKIIISKYVPRQEKELVKSAARF